MEPWVFYGLFSAVFAALATIFAKLGLQNIDNTFATTVRAIIMAVFLIATSWYFGKIKLLNSLNAYAFWFIVLSGLAGALSWLFYFRAVQLVPQMHLSAVGALDRLSIVFILLLSVLLLQEKLTFIKLLGALLISCGALFMNL